ncbi:hypothetical protein FNV43_RR12868 [Rhamnella rubrinervis]|uniref:Thioredoxin domain-containing protein n=1 Tax=Rhamnella rubrinervis TaxID=2594499 RepID=A0A8K0H011_9ROSA|nr:hypothetical protein FNV43_RR12868 [Rhamnella rubrinervis]
MGAAISRVLGGGPVDDGSSSSSSEPSRVQAFHSSERWQLHFNELKNSSKLMVIDFSATWCGPCKFMEPIFNHLSNKFTDVDFAKIDVDELSEGKEVDRLVGATRDDLKKKIENHRRSA